MSAQPEVQSIADHADDRQQKPVEAVAIAPPKTLRRRLAEFAKHGERKTRYSLPEELHTASPVGYRKRVALSRDEAQQALQLLALERPSGFGPVAALEEGELFEECALGVMSARQSTNYRGHQQVTFGPDDSRRLSHLLRSLGHLDAPVLDNASYTHV